MKKQPSHYLVLFFFLRNNLFTFCLFFYIGKKEVFVPGHIEFIRKIVAYGDTLLGIQKVLISSLEISWRVFCKIQPYFNL